MKKYKIKQKCIIFNIVATVLFYTLWVVVSCVLIKKDICGYMVLIPVVPGFLLFICLAVSDRNAYVEIHDDKLIYNRYGRNITVMWTGIVRLEHKRLLWKKGFARMMIHTTYMNFILCVNTEFEDYLELCSCIINAYATSIEMPIVDPKLLTLVR